MRSSVASMMRSVWQQGSCRKARRSLGQGQPHRDRTPSPTRGEPCGRQSQLAVEAWADAGRGRSEGALRERWTGSNR